MTILIWIVIGGLAVALVAATLNRLPRQRAMAVVVLLSAAALAALRMFPLAVPAAAFGYGLWRRGAPAPAPSGGQRSQARTPRLAMALDHDSGELDGEVLAGPFSGRRLSALDPGDLQKLVSWLEDIPDTDSLALLLAYLDRRRGPEPAAPPADATAMSEAEAYGVLGLAPGASLDEVRAAYHRLIRRVHPDLGGSSALAAMLNAAKERLDPDPARPQ